MPSPKKIYEDETGFITGCLMEDGYWWINEFVIHPPLRGMGFGHDLMKHMPQKCRLHALPLISKKEPNGLQEADLIRFYEKHGFRREDDKNGNVIMVRD